MFCNYILLLKTKTPTAPPPPNLKHFTNPIENHFDRMVVQWKISSVTYGCLRYIITCIQGSIPLFVSLIYNTDISLRRYKNEPVQTIKANCCATPRDRTRHLRLVRRKR